MTKQLLLLELNEVNFDFVESYAARGELPCLAALIARHGIATTTSEDQYEQLEPWIQWVTAHTGKSFAEHGVFRLGDIVQHDHSQIWEELEERGLLVGAVSPMNAKFRLKRPAFFVPDPWTTTDIVAPSGIRRLYEAICQAVSDNAQSRISSRSALSLLGGLARYASPRNYAWYMRFVATARTASWNRAMLLDLLLSDVFIHEVRRTQPAFASFFVNAAAHIQHHYMFASAVYRGPVRNPDWYVPAGRDPLLDVYRLYDRIVRQIAEAFPGARLMLATGLHQDPFGYAKYYWRLRAHADFLSLIGVPHERVEARMSRDFVVTCRDVSQGTIAQKVLESAVDKEGERLFEVDNRGSDLFVMLVYPKDIAPDMQFSVNGRTFGHLRNHVAFVALKNGEHNGIGYFLDTGIEKSAALTEFPLKRLPERVRAAFGLTA